MSNPTIAGKRPIYSDSNALAAIGDAILAIKAADGLTWDDVGKVFGVSDDQAANYANGRASMSVTTYGRGKREWNGRFTGAFDRLCVDSRPGTINDRHCHTSLLEAALAFSVALEDGEFSTEEVRANRQTLEAAKDAIEAQLSKLTVAAA
jgi:transcriptional regulator with XRE-family HTH domain